MLIKIVIVTVLLIILFCLGSGLFFLIRDKGKSVRTAKALTWRIAISVGLFALLMIAAATGLIKPHGIYPIAPATTDQSYNQ